ncbi:hypothetical protein HDU98_010287 [Podochytrium sp. JEL0797]|nr:hypothetical protein HDU98_010287 [Podochytrium sp. JEL0797]
MASSSSYGTQASLTPQTPPTAPLAPPMTPFAWILQRSFLADYLALVILAIAAIVAELAPPFIRPIDAAVLSDEDLRHPVVPNIVPIWAVALVAGILPIFLMATVLQLTVPRAPRKQTIVFRNMHRFVMAQGCTIALTVLTTDLIKNSVGRFRPDFLDRCQYSNVTMACTGPASVVTEGRKSFPSGHTSFAFAGGVLLSLWGAQMAGLWASARAGGIEGEEYRLVESESVEGLDLEARGASVPAPVSMSMAVARTRGSESMAGWLVIVAFAVMPVLAAVYVGITRLQQFVHHPTDVLAGAAIGTFYASVVYYIHFWRR